MWTGPCQALRAKTEQAHQNAKANEQEAEEAQESMVSPGWVKWPVAPDVSLCHGNAMGQGIVHNQQIDPVICRGGFQRVAGEWAMI